MRSLFFCRFTFYFSVSVRECECGNVCCHRVIVVVEVFFCAPYFMREYFGMLKEIFALHNSRLVPPRPLPLHLTLFTATYSCMYLFHLCSRRIKKKIYSIGTSHLTLVTRAASFLYCDRLSFSLYVYNTLHALLLLSRCRGRCCH